MNAILYCTLLELDYPVKQALISKMLQTTPRRVLEGATESRPVPCAYHADTDLGGALPFL
jgi:hypothetical protein